MNHHMSGVIIKKNALANNFERRVNYVENYLGAENV